MSAVATAVRGPSVYGIASKGGRLREVGLTNTTATAFAAALARFQASLGVEVRLTACGVGLLARGTLPAGAGVPAAPES